MTELWALENEIYDSGVELICGVDAAGAARWPGLFAPQQSSFREEWR